MPRSEAEEALFNILNSLPGPRLSEEDVQLNGSIVLEFRSAVAKCNINDIPKVVGKLLDPDRNPKPWQNFFLRSTYKPETFLDFIRKPPREGCGWDDPGMVEALIVKSGDRKTLRLWRQATVAPKHVHHAPSTVKPARGNSLAYTLDRLHRERPDLLKKVESGKLSAHAAAIEAGFRKQSSPLEQILKLIPKLTDAEQGQVIEVLQKLRMETEFKRSREEDARRKLDPHRPVATPRNATVPGSPGWCYMTVEMMKHNYKHVHTNQGLFTKYLNELRQYRAWEKVPVENPYGSEAAMLRTELGNIGAFDGERIYQSVRNGLTAPGGLFD